MRRYRSVAAGAISALLITMPASVAQADLPAAWHLDWNPDGRSIAVEAAGDLWLVDVATASTRRLTDTPGITESSPVWSPDGRWLSYGSGPDDPTAPDPNSAAIDPQIWLMTSAGAQRHSTGVHGVPTSWRTAP
jgi:TolB protein